MKKVLSLLLIISLICSFCAAFATAVNAESEQYDCTQCLFKPKEKKPDITAKPEPTPKTAERPEARRAPNANQPNANQPNANQPNANQPNANQPNANQPNANQPNANQPNANRPDTQRPTLPNAGQPRPNLPENIQPKQDKPKENPMNTLQKRFDALSDEQRSEVYKITDELNEKFIVLTDKYREIGLLTKQEADQITGVLKNGYAMAKASGRIIFALPPMR